jgi:hypothetical protein
MQIKEALVLFDPRYKQKQVRYLLSESIPLLIILSGLIHLALNEKTFHPYQVFWGKQCLYEVSGSWEFNRRVPCGTHQPSLLRPPSQWAGDEAIFENEWKP